MSDLDLDRLVAEKVMGWDVHYRLPAGERPSHEGVEHWRDHRNNTIYLPGQWSPATSEEAAFDVVRQMRSDGFSFKLWQPNDGFYETPTEPMVGAVASFICSRGPCEKHGNPHHNHHGAYDVEGKALCLVICKAALVAMKVIPEQTEIAG